MLEMEKDYQVWLAWKSEAGGNATAAFIVQFKETIPGKSGGIVVRVKELIEGGVEENVFNLEDLPEAMKKEVKSLIGKEIEIHEDSLVDQEPNWIRIPIR